MLSLINAFPSQLQKRTTSFVQCPPIQGTTTPPTFISVTLNPDPVVPGIPDKFTVSGILDSDITVKTKLFVFYADPITGNAISDLYYGHVCEETGCPIKAKTPFSTSVVIPTPQNLPNPYGISVNIVDIESREVIGCAYTIVNDIVPTVFLHHLYIDNPIKVQYVMMRCWDDELQILF
ncbi:8202_t:CDS:2 [Funneliformis geosporum]|uniref:Phosphatidylglycerol/phosphatidylinositol transfer protein n=1 Tax=Funneliformis geosporum TaxID=1117311 RepID=A0A9W4WPL1_9GLOM|nr:8202_t:CDS:2 [Funneliformis geosporum]CAI2169416.1 6371_t:CDS:2 [Funneliformis geosporum]